MSSNQNAQNQLVTWINDAGMAAGNRKADLLRKINEIMIHQTPESVPLYLDTILSWVNDKSTEVKKQIVFLIEELSKLQPEFLPKIVSALLLMFTDSVIAVQKRVLQAGSIVYSSALTWICKSNADVAEKKSVWDMITRLKLQIANLIDSENEGLRTQTVKFLEEIVLLQSYSESIDNDDFSLEKVPLDSPILTRSKLEEESAHVLDLLLKFHNSQHISGVNLLACMNSLSNICKTRPKFMPHVLRGFINLYSSLPPTLSQSQVLSVKKQLKCILVSLLKHPTSNEYFGQITQLLLDTGMTNQEIMKILPRERRYKRLGDRDLKEFVAKRIKLDPLVESKDMTEPFDSKNVTEDSLFDGLNNIGKVATLVFDTLSKNLPNSMPLSFNEQYKPISNAGSVIQKRKLAKLLYNLIQNIEEPVSYQPFLTSTTKIPLLKDDDEKISLMNAVAKLQETTKVDKLIESSKIESAVSKLMEETRLEQMREKDERVTIPLTPVIPKLKHRVKLLKLQEITMPIPKEIKEKLILQAVSRILRAEKDCMIGGAAQIRLKLISTFASSYSSEIRDLVLNYILEDPSNRIDLALAWLYEEFSYYRNYHNQPVTLQPKQEKCSSYNNLLCGLITQLNERGDLVLENCKDVLLRRVYLEAPLITDEAVDYLKALILDDKLSVVCLEILEDLCLMRVPFAHKYIVPLLAQTLNHKAEIRDIALQSIMKLYNKNNERVVRVVEKSASLYVGFIGLRSPPVELMADYHKMNNIFIWSDDLYKLCLNLIMALYPYKEDLIIDVARVYGNANADAKRCVLRAIEAPVRQVVASSEMPRPAFMRLLEECPKGAETLLTRLVHIITEKSPPTPELVSRVRDLYATRVSDVRFLIPVLNGLTKKEILAALPKLIKLNPVVVKEVFNKLLGLQNVNDEILPVSPTELLVTLHLIDPIKADLKYIIKATALCFAEKHTYTQDVVAGVLQILVEEEPIPVLLMRSVLQALAIYPSLSGLVLNILQTLIEKEVWLNKVAWEGWIKCCERVLPESVSVLLKLPAAPFMASMTAPVLTAAVRLQVTSLSPSQRVCLPLHVRQIIGVNDDKVNDLQPPGMEDDKAF